MDIHRAEFGSDRSSGISVHFVRFGDGPRRWLAIGASRCAGYTGPVILQSDTHLSSVTRGIARKLTNYNIYCRRGHAEPQLEQENV